MAKGERVKLGGGDLKEMIPSEFHLSQNFPNPFSGATTIKFCVAYRSRVTLDLIHCDSGAIQRITDEEKMAGTFEVALDSRWLQEGSYICLFRAGEFVATKEMLLKR